MNFLWHIGADDLLMILQAIIGWFVVGLVLGFLLGWWLT
jgi:hypothetical protein